MQRRNRLQPVFYDRPDVAPTFEGKTVCIVGSGPGSLENPTGLVDSHDVVVRVNNYKLFPATGYRTDVFYSFFGASIKKTAAELKRDGVKLCLCKCPNAQFMESAWHRLNGKMNGVDFRGIYERRKAFWFGPTYIPTVDEFKKSFHMLGDHVPTTGFSAILEVLSFNPKHLYLTGFDFFASGKHNVTERWRKMNPADPIGHAPDRECAWLSENIGNYPITIDTALAKCLE
jgi:hypothetical protein